MFTKTLRQAPADEVAKNAQLLIRAGFIHKEMAGVYAYLPLGLRVLEKIKQIIREEMNALGGEELIMTNLQPKAAWEKTTRWDDEVVDIWFKTKLKDETELGLAWSHEEAIVQMLRPYVQSYKDLPIRVYQFQTKLRNELRAKSGIMRGREFVMKDMYSLHVSKHDLDAFYNQAVEAYQRIYDRLGIGEDTFVTFASGGAFTKFSHEFQTICPTGEDEIYLHRGKNIAVNSEMIDDQGIIDELHRLQIEKSELEKVRTAEVGNVFNFGVDKAEQMDVEFADASGQQKPFYLGSYGIGVTRVMGVIAEKFADERGLVWSDAIAPARVYLINIGNDDDVVKNTTKLYEELKKAGIEVIWDDRDARPGEKFADAELMGIPHRVVVSPKLLAQNLLEYQPRTLDIAENLTTETLFDKLK